MPPNVTTTLGTVGISATRRDEYHIDDKVDVVQWTYTDVTWDVTINGECHTVTALSLEAAIEQARREHHVLNP